MSDLILVRHAQASFLSDDYDKLSCLGEKQSAQLADFWLSQQLEIDEVYCGPRVRHLKTAELVGRRFHTANVDFPQIQRIDEFDEHQVDQLVLHKSTDLQKKSEKLKRLFSAYHASDPSQKPRAFQMLFEAAAQHWVRNEDFDVESWVDFHRRVNRGLDKIVKRSGSGRKIAVFTSVGPVAVAMQRALDCADDVTLRTSWRLWNTSVSRFVFSGDRFTLDMFNSIPHLDIKNRTYR